MCERERGRKYAHYISQPAWLLSIPDGSGCKVQGGGFRLLGLGVGGSDWAIEFSARAGLPHPVLASRGLSQLRRVCEVLSIGESLCVLRVGA